MERVLSRQRRRSGGATWEEGVGDDGARRTFWARYLGVVESALVPTRCGAILRGERVPHARHWQVIQALLPGP